jgi:hypothetical protein
VSDEKDDLWDKIAAWLAEPFEPRQVKWLPKVVRQDSALGMPYVDSRTVMDRLDAVLGMENWQDSYDFLPDRAVMCRLAVRLPGTAEWITKSDVGTESEQPDQGDRSKSAVSDALKRAAVHWGVARYLYRVPSVWARYDAKKKQFSEIPQLPAWALPGFGARKEESKAASKPGATGQAGNPAPHPVSPAEGQKAYDQFVRQIKAVAGDAEWQSVAGAIKAVVQAGGGGMTPAHVQGLRDALAARWDDMHPKADDEVGEDDSAGDGDDVSDVPY